MEIYVQDDYLKATALALAAGSSKVALPFLKAIEMDDRLIAPGLTQRGASAYGQTKISLQPGEAGIVLSELKRAQEAFGPMARFGNRQLSLLISQWARFEVETSSKPHLEDSN